MKGQIDIIPEMKDFDKIFNQITNGGYRYDDNQVFNHFLDISLSNWQREATPGLPEEMRRTYKEDILKHFGELHNCFFKSLQKAHQNSNNEWYWIDLLGGYYEAMTSRSKRKWGGQFFTPEHICQFMTQCMFTESEDGKEKSINDPASGSGRFLLAAHSVLKGKCICYAEDIDIMCAKMTALNMFSHGVKGEVLCHDSLMPESFTAGWHINAHLQQSGVPSIARITADQSHIIAMWKDKLENEPQEAAKELEQKKTSIQSPQLNLF